MKKNEHKKGSQLKLSSNEMKGLKKYKESYVEDVKEMHDAIKETVPYYALEVYKEFVKMVSEYHTKYIQILGGTSFVKELVPVKKVINEASKYSVDFEWGVCCQSPIRFLTRESGVFIEERDVRSHKRRM